VILYETMVVTLFPDRYRCFLEQLFCFRFLTLLLCMVLLSGYLYRFYT